MKSLKKVAKCLLLKSSINENHFSCLLFVSGTDGTAREMIELPSGKSIKVPDNYRLEVSVVPCERFWESDLSGGRFLLKADIVPIEPIGDYTVKCFEDFILIAEEHYKDGVLQASPQFKEK